nr:hypothetical protein [Tanacetum cinerariifolium]
MADMNIPMNDDPAEQAYAVASPTRSDDQILPSSNWVPIDKSNCVLDVQKSQRNPIFSVVVAILKNTNFFMAFTASFTIPAIYIQQFWDTMCFNLSTGFIDRHCRHVPESTWVSQSVEIAGIVKDAVKAMKKLVFFSMATTTEKIGFLWDFCTSSTQLLLSMGTQLLDGKI